MLQQTDSTSPLPDKPLIVVDDLVSYSQAPKPGAEFHFGNGKQSCHMTVDGPLHALHAFASRIGLQRSWFQSEDTLPHYDLTPGKRSQAIGFGALGVPGTAMMRARIARIAASHREGCDCKSCTTARNCGGPVEMLRVWQDVVLEAQLASAPTSRHHVAGLCKRAITAAWLADKHAAFRNILANAEDLDFQGRDFKLNPKATESARLRQIRFALNELLGTIPPPPHEDAIEFVEMIMAAAAPIVGRRRA